jgi:small-conductance mechanosensitive channel
MTDPHRLVFLRELGWSQLLFVVVVLIACGLLVAAMRALVRRAAENAPSRRRLLILKIAPLARLAIGLAGIAIVVPVLVEPNFEDVTALLATVALALAFALKDYVSALAAGIVTILENTYQPGDWIEVDGAYGEVKTIGMRAVHIVTADDTEMIVPHSRLWTSTIANASGGSHSLLCVTNIWLAADHDGEAVQKALTAIAEASPFRAAGTGVKVMAAETPWGTHYKIKAYVADSRDQFAMISDITLRAKTQLRTMSIAYAQAPYAESKPPAL